MTEIYIHQEIERVIELHEPVIERTTAETTVKEQLESLSDNLLAHFNKRNPAVTTEIKNWHPGFIGADRETILSAQFGIGDARETIARGHGFDGWPDVSERGTAQFNPAFERVIDTLLSGDFQSLKNQIELDQSLLTERSKYGHRATLLHYVSSNGVEMRRQRVPLNLPQMTRYLIAVGADRHSVANLYGGQFTALELASTSAHPSEAGIMTSLIDALENI